MQLASITDAFSIQRRVQRHATDANQIHRASKQKRLQRGAAGALFGKQSAVNPDQNGISSSMSSNPVLDLAAGAFGAGAGARGGGAARRGASLRCSP